MPYSTPLIHHQSFHFDYKTKASQPRKMSSTTRAWMVAGTVGLVEALKDQGFARWN
ncbi:hypothetical protein Hanom_Chr09g00868901 [Helianthus anomalus]